MPRPEEELYKCYTCCWFFNHRRSLTRHIESQHKSWRSFPCKQCEQVFTRRDNLLAHYRRLHEDCRGERARQRKRGRDDCQRCSVSPRRHKSKSRSRSPHCERRVESVISRPEKEGEITPQVEASPQVEACPQPEIEIEVSPGMRQRDPVSLPPSDKPHGMMALMRKPRDESGSEASGSEADRGDRT